MKSVPLLLAALLAALTSPLIGQTNFIYDQQSSIEGNVREGGAQITFGQPIGQSFIPSLSSVGFIRLYLGDGLANGVGASIYLNLRANSITGPILSSTPRLDLPDRFARPVDFIFGRERWSWLGYLAAIPGKPQPRDAERPECFAG